MHDDRTHKQNDQAWGRFARLAILSCLSTILFLIGVIVVADPYDTLPFSPGFDRAPATTNQRFSYPTVAMNPNFDSIVIGTSTTRLLDPDRLNEVLSGRFANLSLNSGTPYEQSQILDLFLRYHPEPNTIIFGIDETWCGTFTAPKHTNRPFPPWLYDGNPWNDVFHLLNFSTLEQSGRSIAQLMGLRDEKYRRDGYRNFLPPNDEYDLARAQGHIYRGDVRPLPEAVDVPLDRYRSYRAGLSFPDHVLIDRILDTIPASVRKIFLIVPIHAIGIAPPGSREEAMWHECIARLSEMAANAGNADLFNFRIRSDVTTDDRNYWDNLHFGTSVADRIVGYLGEGIEAGRATNSAYEYERFE